MRMIRKFENGQLGEIRSYLRSSDEQLNEQNEKYIPGLSSERKVVDEDLAGDELEAFLDKEIRPKRDQLLKDTDAQWIELSSKGESLTAINTYKQALRDFPSNLDLSEIDYVDEIVWPVLGE